jgi:hypothetical protein
MYLTMIRGGTCGTSLSGLIFASCTAPQNRSVMAAGRSNREASRLGVCIGGSMFAQHCGDGCRGVADQGWGWSCAPGSVNLSSSGRLTTIGSGFERVTTQTVG